MKVVQYVFLTLYVPLDVNSHELFVADGADTQLSRHLVDSKESRPVGVTPALVVSGKLWDVVETVVFSDGAVFELLKTVGTGRLDVHKNPVDNSVAVAFDSESVDFPLLVCNNVPGFFCQEQHHFFEKVTVLELEVNLGAQGFVWGIHRPVMNLSRRFSNRRQPESELTSCQTVCKGRGEDFCNPLPVCLGKPFVGYVTVFEETLDVLD